MRSRLLDWPGVEAGRGAARLGQTGAWAIEVTKMAGCAGCVGCAGEQSVGRVAMRGWMAATCACAARLMLLEGVGCKNVGHKADGWTDRKMAQRWMGERTVGNCAGLPAPH